MASSAAAVSKRPIPAGTNKATWAKRATVKKAKRASAVMEKAMPEQADEAKKAKKPKRQQTSVMVPGGGAPSLPAGTRLATGVVDGAASLNTDTVYNKSHFIDRLVAKTSFVANGIADNVLIKLLRDGAEASDGALVIGTVTMTPAQGGDVMYSIPFCVANVATAREAGSSLEIQLLGPLGKHLCTAFRTPPFKVRTKVPFSMPREDIARTAIPVDHFEHDAEKWGTDEWVYAPTKKWSKAKLLAQEAFYERALKHKRPHVALLAAKVHEGGDEEGDDEASAAPSPAKRTRRR